MQSIAPAPIAQMQSHGHHHGIQEMSADNDLRAQLTAAVGSSQQQQQQQHHHQGPPPPPPGIHGYSDPRPSSSASPHDHNIDPAIGGAGGMMSAGPGGDNDDDDSMDGRKGGKRELSQSKRAAQNRAAQRAFRQRKEGYIKKLEEQVRELHTLEDNFKAIQSENYSLREYIIHLQSRLIESQGDLPPPPPNVNLAHPTHPGPVRHEGASMAPMSQLQASAVRGIAAAGLGKEDNYDKNRYKGGPAADENQTDDDVIRAQLQAGTAQHV